MPALAPSLTDMLRSYSNGDRSVADAVLREVLPTLHQIATRALSHERSPLPLDPTELIHEAWMRSLGAGKWQVTDRGHFYSIASVAMRRVLVDLARQRTAQRRGRGALHGPLDESLEETAASAPMVGASPEAIVELGELLDGLETIYPEAARIVDMHYVAGFTLEEIAKATGLSLRQVRHQWEKGRDWLKDRMR